MSHLQSLSDALTAKGVEHIPGYPSIRIPSNDGRDIYIVDCRSHRSGGPGVDILRMDTWSRDRRLLAHFSADVPEGWVADFIFSVTQKWVLT